jgi:hypothetical protein
LVPYYLATSFAKENVGGSIRYEHLLVPSEIKACAISGMTNGRKFFWMLLMLSEKGRQGLGMSGMRSELHCQKRVYCLFERVAYRASQSRQYKFFCD